ncbi:hypothetical protein [Nostoc sp. LPT]|uniref:hypothetical protein n=1 Tax=Nostoc sp. LPT TaxID=2815387 RepID=UPI001DF7E9F7|nr:hypothetical protein [Nostoc sp. LPT]MBN4006869.1 hypothetical protein [Nostoc sp. LPT]
MVRVIKERYTGFLLIFWLWSLLFIVWTVWAWWAVPAALLGLIFAYYWTVDAAGVYCSLLESAFDLYRFLELYKSLRWPIPINPKQEQEFDKGRFYWL